VAKKRSVVRMVASASPANRRSAEVFQRIVNEVTQLQAAILRYGDAVGTNHAVSASRWQVLVVLARTSLSVAAVARRLGLKRQSVQRTTDLLVAEGLVEMTDNPDHSRAMLGRLTPTGKRVHAQLAARQRAFCRECTRDIGLQDLLQFERTLGILRDRIDAAGTSAMTSGAKVRQTLRRKRATQR